ncbi:MAG: tryptophan synthase subunit alpha [Beduini sp.]|uniref:tryptophan synthase subunit alpha n=1 Tax=Beduini sp. TaxID=1922300 RepID=UPI0011C8477B
MNRIDDTLQTLNSEQKTAMIGYSIIGDPNREVSMAIVKQMVKNGCDMIELGLPFSDPIALNMDLQKANVRALSQHMTTPTAMQCIKEIRETTMIPIILNVYYNQIFCYGIDKFFCEASSSGIDGIFIGDLPIEHQPEVMESAQKYNIYLLSLITPSSSKRIKKIAENAQGYLYCVAEEEELPQFIKVLNKETPIPKIITMNQESLLDFENGKCLEDGIKIEDMIIKEIPRLLETAITLEELGQTIKKISNRVHQ